jgi:hypothetical protein
MKRFPVIAAAWAAILVLGFAVVILLGTPPATAADELQTAMHPATPVSEATARSSAATIVRLGYPDLASLEPIVNKRTDFGIEHWVVEYADTTGRVPTGVRISITVNDGNVEVTAFP